MTASKNEKTMSDEEVAASEEEVLRHLREYGHTQHLERKLAELAPKTKVKSAVADKPAAAVTVKKATVTPGKIGSR